VFDTRDEALDMVEAMSELASQTAGNDADGLSDVLLVGRDAQQIGELSQGQCEKRKGVYIVGAHSRFGFRDALTQFSTCLAR
jgi:hypothetical protein